MSFGSKNDYEGMMKKSFFLLMLVLCSVLVLNAQVYSTISAKVTCLQQNGIAHVHVAEEGYWLEFVGPMPQIEVQARIGVLVENTLCSPSVYQTVRLKNIWW